MKFFNMVRGLTLSVLIVCSSVASAAVIEFGSSAANPFPFEFRNFDNVIGDIDLTITAGVFSDSSGLITLANSGSNNSRSGFEFSDGLGAIGGNDDNNEIDGQGRNDIVIFTFSEEVSFLALEFGNVDSRDDFNFGLVDGDTFLNTLTDVRITSEDFVLSNELIGTVFAVGAVERNDSFTISSITVTSIPEPSTIAIFALGLMGLLRLRRA